MGEIADAMIEGLFCQSCGDLIDGESPGRPRKCPDCIDDADDLISPRCERFNRSYPRAAALAAEVGVTLKRMKNEGHYQLIHPKRAWLMNVYANKRGIRPRAYHDPKRKGPFVALPDGAWDLVDAVKGVAKSWREPGDGTPETK